MPPSHAGPCDFLISVEYEVLMLVSGDVRLVGGVALGRDLMAEPRTWVVEWASWFLSAA